MIEKLFNTEEPFAVCVSARSFDTIDTRDWFAILKDTTENRAKLKDNEIPFHLNVEKKVLEVDLRKNDFMNYQEKFIKTIHEQEGMVYEVKEKPFKK